MKKPIKNPKVLNLGNEYALYILKLINQIRIKKNNNIK